MTIEKRYFNKLVERLEEQFEKGERCSCGKRLEARSKSLVLNGYANLYLKEALDEQLDRVREIVKGCEDIYGQLYMNEVLDKLDKLK